MAVSKSFESSNTFQEHPKTNEKSRPQQKEMIKSYQLPSLTQITGKHITMNSTSLPPSRKNTIKVSGQAGGGFNYIQKASDCNNNLLINSPVRKSLNTDLNIELQFTSLEHPLKADESQVMREKKGTLSITQNDMATQSQELD